MAENTDNHGYETPSQGTEDWHEPLNQNFEELDIDVEVRDVSDNRETYEPNDGAKFLELDTGIIYVGDGDTWKPALATAYYDENGDLVSGELTACIDDGSNGSEHATESEGKTFGKNAKSVHDGAIVFGDSTTRSIWSRTTDEIRSQMPIHAPSVSTSGAGIAGRDIVAAGSISGNSIEAQGQISGSSLHTSTLSVDSSEFVVDFDEEYPQVEIEPEQIMFSVNGLEGALTIGDGIYSPMPMYAPEFVETNSSARALKSGVEPVNPQSVLDAVRSLTVSTWEYQTDDGCRHMGPMAEDFAATFGLGYSDESIATVDADGVALAAIQGLAQRLESVTDRLSEQLAAKSNRIETLEAENETLRARLSTIESKLEMEISGDHSVSTDD